VFVVVTGLFPGDRKANGSEQSSREDADGEVFKPFRVLSRHEAHIQQLEGVQHQQKIARQFHQFHTLNNN